MEYMNKWNSIVEVVRKNYTAKEALVQQSWEFLFQFVFGYAVSEIDAQRAIKMGSTSKKPDIILRKDEEDLCVIELKRHILHDGREQLFSYLNQLKMNLGVVVCDKLYLYDYDFTQKENAYAEVEIPFEENNEDGAKFVELFSKDNFDKQKISDFIRSKSNSKDVIAKIKSETTSELIKDLLKAHFKAKYAVSDEDFDSAISSLSISLQPRISTQTISAFEKTEIAHIAEHSENDLDKSQIMKICYSNGINISSDFTKSKLNKTQPKYWANPNKRFLSQDWWLVLLNNTKREMYIFMIPRHSIKAELMCYKTEDLIDLQIYSDLYSYPDFQDSRSGIKFKQWLVATISY